MLFEDLWKRYLIGRTAKTGKNRFVTVVIVKSCNIVKSFNAMDIICMMFKIVLNVIIIIIIIDNYNYYNCIKLY